MTHKKNMIVGFVCYHFVLVWPWMPIKNPVYKWVFSNAGYYAYSE